MVPAVFAPWARDLLDAVGLGANVRVLDVACGTGIVARLAAERAGTGGRVAGVDANESMLVVARAQPALVEWHQADASRLPFASGEFDVVVCQQGLQYMPDRLAALREMKRVLAPGGRLGLSVFRQSVGHETFRAAAALHVGDAAAAIVMEPFSFADTAALSALLRQAELRNARVQTRALTVHFPSIDGFIEYQLAGRLAGAASQLGAEARAALVAQVRRAFAPLTAADGVAFAMEANVVLADA